MANNNMEEQVPQEVVPQEEAQMDPRLEKELQTYTTGLSELLHGKQTSPQIVDMLKNGGPPEQSIPHAVTLVNTKMADSIGDKGQRPSLEVLFGGTIFLVNDLLEMGIAANAFGPPDEDGTVNILKQSIQAQIQAGLKDGTIDPVELQEKVEPMMNEQARVDGMQVGASAGIPDVPDEMTAMEAYGAKRQQKGMLQGKAQGQPQGAAIIQGGR